MIDTLLIKIFDRAALKRALSLFICVAFVINSVISPAYAQMAANLPVPGTMVQASSTYIPTLLKGMTVHPEDPFRFDFIVDNGQSELEGDKLQAESRKLVNYFLASMTVPSDDLWVNLSPMEHDRIIPEGLGKSELGEGLLAQDYILKQLTATLMYPESDLGKKFWDRVYQRAEEKFGTSDIPTDTFNKVWIMPESASVYENGASVFVVGAKLKIMLDSDYQAAAGNDVPNGPAQELAKEIMREVIVPEIEKEVNEGKNFAPLRQIFYSLILAKWYKQKVRNSLLSKVYIDQNKMQGIDLSDPLAKEDIYNRYLEAYKKGVYNYIKEEYSPAMDETISRKYFSGGFLDKEVEFAQADKKEVVGIGAFTRLGIYLNNAGKKIKKTVPVVLMSAMSYFPSSLAAFQPVKVIAIGLVAWVLQSCTEEIDLEKYTTPVPTIDDVIKVMGDIKNTSSNSDEMVKLNNGIIHALEANKYTFGELVDRLAAEPNKGDKFQSVLMKVLRVMDNWQLYMAHFANKNNGIWRINLEANYPKVLGLLMDGLQNGGPLTQEAASYVLADLMYREFNPNVLAKFDPILDRDMANEILDKIFDLNEDIEAIWAFVRLQGPVGSLSHAKATPHMLGSKEVQAFFNQNSVQRAAFLADLKVFVKDHVNLNFQNKANNVINGLDKAKPETLSVTQVLIIYRAQKTGDEGLRQDFLSTLFSYADVNPQLKVSNTEGSEVTNAQTSKRQVEQLEPNIYGGIDMNDININADGAGVQFDPAVMDQLINGRVDGFSPVVVSFTPVDSLLPLLK
jgi:hypothetical protein